MRIVIAEDNVLLATGLELLLTNSGYEVAEVAADAEGFLAAVDRRRPAVTIVDVRLPPRFRDEGIRAAIEARRVHPGLPVLVLSQYVEQTYALELLSSSGGGVGYLLKDRISRVDEFLEALDRVAAGGTALDPDVVTQLLARQTQPLSTLTPREQEVLALMAEGHDNATLAKKLSITDNAVHKHIGNIFAKFGLTAADVGHRRVRAVLTYLEAR
ncbi:response regulator transcription factor [Streptomyces sp. XD-27]|uniref:response regulator n=1 Tax=Streptomyces sp. XD-27 TaxID=3062779 RepID=UPI0026F45375|nr:response regulator transcription factor [Streptomyces sp. XD-27]WKX74032.1 response regulator transcription factor [Streptomyces sp. XD-27]